jgi:hypothetical protein
MRSTTGTVRARIAKSRQMVHPLTYSASSAITSSNDVMLLRPLTCQGPVIPGLTSNRRKE